MYEHAPGRTEKNFELERREQMALYAIGDLHLCLGAPKPMDVFGGAWVGYMDKLKRGCSAIGTEDTTVLLGDLS